MEGIRTGGSRKHLSHEEIEKQAAYLYPRVLEALRNQTRRDILELLARDPKGKLAFSEIKSALSGIKNASLSNHLRVLQMADLVARTVRLEDRRQNPDPYYCFYNITKFGEYVTRSFQTEVKRGVELAVS